MLHRHSLAIVLLLALASACSNGQEYKTTEALLDLIETESEPYVLVDVRTPQEFATGHIPTAVNIPHISIAEQPPTDDKDALIILYCRSGSRSTVAEQALRKAGYKRIVNFGGILDWTGPTVKP
jgi:rhodanese-related sulfurtransferase